MPLTSAQYSQLKSELVNDPLGIGYAVPYASGADTDVAALLNTVRDGGAYQVDASPVLASDVVKSISAADFGAMTPTDFQKLTILFLMGPINLADTTTRGLLASVFPAGGTTRTNLLALSKRQGARVEVLFGTGVRVTASDIAQARNAT